MSTHFITSSELEKFLAVYATYGKERPDDEPPFMQILSWMDSRQGNQVLFERNCQPGEIIVREDEQGDVFYVIRSGHAVVVKGGDLTQAILGFRWKGDAIGEMALIDNKPRSATVVSLTEMSLWCIDRQLFYQFLGENPAFSLNIMNMLSGRIRQSSEERARGFVREKQLGQAIEDLNQQATRDPLTGLFNRRFMDEALRKELRLAQDDLSTVGILIADVDFFKRVNDTYGHKAGDMVLQELGKLLKSNVRSADYVCRYGGEEFVVILPGVPMTALERSAEYIRTSFEMAQFQFEDKIIRATISIGAAMYPQHGASGNEVLEHADHALYHAKRTGRNRVIIYSSELVSQPPQS